MDHQGVFRLRAALLFAVLIPALSLNTMAYFKSGGSVAFTPAPVSVPITSVAWKLNGDVVAEWVKDIVPEEYNGVLKDHGKLNVESGELSIEKMTQAHEGVYTVEINSRFLPGDFKAELVKELPHPEVDVQPSSCNFEVCALNCLGDTHEAGPVTFYWKVGDGEWNKSSAVLNIYNQEESKRPQTYACRMVNPVSQRDSKPISDPFSSTSPPLGPKEKVGVIFGVLLILVVIVVVVVVVTYLCRHREPFKGFWNRLTSCIVKEVPPSTAPEASKLVEHQPAGVRPQNESSEAAGPSNGHRAAGEPSHEGNENLSKDKGSPAQ